MLVPEHNAQPVSCIPHIFKIELDLIIPSPVLSPKLRFLATFSNVCSVFILPFLPYQYTSQDHRHHNHPVNMELGHLLTLPALTHPEVSSVISPGSVCLLVCSFLFSSVIYEYYKAFCLYVATDIICISIFYPKLRSYLIP